MFTRERFCRLMNALRERIRKQEEFLNKLDDVFPNAFEAIYNNFSDEFMINLIAEIMNDTGGYLNYYFYECNCKPFFISINNKEIEINDDVMLYNLIVLSIDEFIDKYSILMKDWLFFLIWYNIIIEERR